MCGGASLTSPRSLGATFGQAWLWIRKGRVFCTALARIHTHRWSFALCAHRRVATLKVRAGVVCWLWPCA